MRTVTATITSIVLLGGSLAVPGQTGENVENPQAVADVAAGKQTVANAAWWGFDPEDSTKTLQVAIDSGAKQLIVPNMGKDWVVQPIRLAGNQELILEKGVVITAKRGEYRQKGDSVLTARDVSNLVIKGYGATVRMHKEDYIVGLLGWKRWYGPYEKAEHRMALSLRGCANVKVYGLTLRDSGGDGLYIAGNKQGPSRNIEVKDVVCDNNYRQGMSVINVDGLLVEHCDFRNTWGTPPSAGVDIEPDKPTHGLQNLVFRNCRFEDNYGDGIQVHLPHTKKAVSILFENCRVTSRRGSGIRISKIFDDGVTGSVEFRNCEVQGTEGYGIKIQDKAALGARLRFVHCTVRDTGRDRQFQGAWTPVWLQFRKSPRITSSRYGGIDFVDCVVEDDHDRPAILLESVSGVEDVTGTITIKNSRSSRPDLGEGVKILVD